ncbi:MAG: hypothetical protein QMC77_04625 [Methanocellales archaeon]|nr:hypothetical protein [Methanocellales archaeon]
MKNFLSDTRDVIEQLYGPVIVQHFPNYGVFWSKFIGVRDDVEDRLVPYGLNLSNVPGENSEEIERCYQELCMAHYTLFCHLAGTHFQITQLENSTKLVDKKERYFRHWEAFELCYLHLGIVFNEIYHLWGLVFLMEKRGNVKRAENGRIYGSEKELGEYLNQIGQKGESLHKQIEKLREDVIILRNNITHFARGLHKLVPRGSGYAIPLKIIKNMLWVNKSKTTEWRLTDFKIKQDIENVETLLNNLHELLIQEFDYFRNQQKIGIRY